MVLLNRFHIQALATDRADAVDSCSAARNGCDAGHAVIDCRAANRLFIEKRLTTERRIDNEMDFSAFDVIHNVRPALVHFVNGFDVYSGTSQNSGCSARCDDLETDLDKISSNS